MRAVRVPPLRAFGPSINATTGHGKKNSACCTVVQTMEACRAHGARPCVSCVMQRRRGVQPESASHSLPWTSGKGARHGRRNGREMQRSEGRTVRAWYPQERRIGVSKRKRRLPKEPPIRSSCQPVEAAGSALAHARSDGPACNQPPDHFRRYAALRCGHDLGGVLLRHLQ